MINAFTSQASQEGASPPAVDCLKRQFQQASEQQLENAFIGSDRRRRMRSSVPAQQYFKAG